MVIGCLSGKYTIKVYESRQQKAFSFPPFPFISSFCNKHKILCLEFRAQQGREEKEQKIQTVISRKCSVSNLLLLLVMTNAQCSVHGQDRQSLALVRLPLSGLVTSLWSQEFRDSPDKFSGSHLKIFLVIKKKMMKASKSIIKGSDCSYGRVT